MFALVFYVLSSRFINAGKHERVVNNLNLFNRVVKEW